MKILVTGCDGYIGSILAPYLLNAGHDVTGIDVGFYRDGWLFNPGGAFPLTKQIDIRLLTPEHLEGFEAIVHLAELSNDPAGQLAPEVTYKINHQGSLHLANLAVAAGVKRFVYASSCSVYGAAKQDIVSEVSDVNPQTVYAECKALVERDLSRMARDNFSPTFLRYSTAFGASPRMRFDIVLNNLAGLAFTTNEIKMTSDGTPWRPIVHIRDISQAVKCTLESPRERIHNQILNVGANDQNYQVRDIATIVSQAFTGCSLTFGQSDSDTRSYRVSFDKIAKVLPDFKCQMKAQDGAEELFRLFSAIKLNREMFESRFFTRLKQLKHLRESEQLDQEFFLRPSLKAVGNQ